MVYIPQALVDKHAPKWLYWEARPNYLPAEAFQNPNWDGFEDWVIKKPYAGKGKFFHKTLYLVLLGLGLLIRDVKLGVFGEEEMYHDGVPDHIRCMDKNAEDFQRLCNLCDTVYNSLPTIVPNELLWRDRPSGSGAILLEEPEVLGGPSAVEKAAAGLSSNNDAPAEPAEDTPTPNPAPAGAKKIRARPKPNEFSGYKKKTDDLPETDQAPDQQPEPQMDQDGPPEPPSALPEEREKTPNPVPPSNPDVPTTPPPQDPVQMSVTPPPPTKPRRGERKAAGKKRTREEEGEPDAEGLGKRTRTYVQRFAFEFSLADRIIVRQ